MHVVSALTLMLDKFNKRRLVAVVKMLLIVSQDLFKMISAWSISLREKISIVSEDHSEMVSIDSDISEMLSTVSENISEI
uniref:Uncharacterized protein n=1 Tax=Arundo donax TaxID=35708 RepID=A0A0A9H8I4_ARUDO